MPEPGTRLPRPIEPPPLPVPAEDCLRLHDLQVLSPGPRPHAAKPDSEDSVMTTEARRRVGAQRDLELMAEDQVLKCDIPTRPSGSKQGAKKEEQQLDHPSA